MCHISKVHGLIYKLIIVVLIKVKKPRTKIIQSSADGDKRKFDGLNVMATTATNKEIFFVF